jgi:hypothetical protein
VKIRVEHTTRFEYDADVVESVVDVRLGPRSDAHQRWGRFKIEVDPAGSVRRYVDGLGNTAFLVTLARPHRHLELQMVGDRDPHDGSIRFTRTNPHSARPAGPC